MKNTPTQLRYGVALSPYGPCAVLMDGKRVRALSLGRPEFPRKHLFRDDGTARHIVRELHSSRAKNISLHVEGTEFQKKVWNALRRIPMGETRTYGEIAQMIGMPRAARAVGSACGANRIAILIPCHRAVPSLGGTGSYRWGKKRKVNILSFEKKMAS